MKYIKLEMIGERININMEGDIKDLVGIVASSMINDPQFATIVISALVVVAEEQNSPLNNINPN